MTDLRTILEHLSIPALNDMQQEAVKTAKNASDLVLLSPTGSGKTLAFLLPVLEQLDPSAPGIQAMVIVPSRELAMQIEQVFRRMKTGIKVSCFYGGHSMQTEKNNLEQPAPLVIGTPGRLADHIRRGTMDTVHVKALVLDEFDKSLELGFQEDMAFIISSLPRLKKRILTSATHGTEVPAFTGIRNPAVLNYLGDTIPPRLTLKIVKAEGHDKLQALVRLLCHIGSNTALIFCNHREAVERISLLLQEHGLEHDVFHGGMEQDARERALIRLRNGSSRILVTTDLASRGLDIPEIKYVIHYQLPGQENAFIHRNGRTARMHAEGMAYLVLAENEYVPEWVKETPETETLPEGLKPPAPTPWTTLYISAGKKEKISKSDIVGFLLQKTGLAKEDLGRIEVLDHASFVAVNKNKARSVLKHGRNEKIKKQQVKIDIAR